MVINIVDGIHQNIFQMVSCDKISFSVAVLQSRHSYVAATFTSKIIAPSSLKPIDPFYCLQYNYIVRNCKSTLKKLITPLSFTFE